jgi:hypothetical protein
MSANLEWVFYWNNRLKAFILSEKKTELAVFTYANRIEELICKQFKGLENKKGNASIYTPSIL